MPCTASLQLLQSQRVILYCLGWRLTYSHSQHRAPMIAAPVFYLTHFKKKRRLRKHSWHLATTYSWSVVQHPCFVRIAQHDHYGDMYSFPFFFIKLTKYFSRSFFWELPRPNYIFRAALVCIRVQVEVEVNWQINMWFKEISLTAISVDSPALIKKDRLRRRLDACWRTHFYIYIYASKEYTLSSWFIVLNVPRC